MKQLYLILLLSFLSLISNAQGWMWAKHFSGTGQNMPRQIIEDKQGNYYVYGNFSGTVTQDTITITSVDGQDAFLAKYNSLGQIQWLKQLGGSLMQNAVNIINSNDNVSFYILLSNYGTCNFDGNSQVTTGGQDVVIAKYLYNGTLQWVKNVAYGIKNQPNPQFTQDQSNNLILTGGFIDYVTFYGGILTLTAPDTIIVQKYIAKFDSNGNPLWSKLILGDNTTSLFRSVTSVNNEYYFSGNFIGNIFFDAGTITSKLQNYRDGFIYKTNNNGTGIWVRKITSNNNDTYVYSHTADENGNQYLASYYNGNKITIDSTAIDTSKLNLVNVNSGTSDLLILKYNSNGILQWAKTMGTTKNEKGNNISYKNNKIIITGTYEGKIGFDNFTLLNGGGSDAFVSECDNNGHFFNAKNAFGKSTDVGYACTYNSTGRNHVAIGDFISDTLTIGANQFINSLAGTRDAYIAKYGCFDSTHFTITPMSCIDAGGMPSLDGAVSATPSDGNAPYTYVWSNGATTQTISNLNLGIYTCTVTGTNGCTLVSSATVTLKPALNASITNINNVICAGQSTGSATITATLGNSPYSYLWSNGATSSTISNVVAGTYFVTVSDQCGTTIVNSANITENPIVNSTISGTNITCRGGSDGSATASPFDGGTPYSYIWSNNATTQTITNLIAGTYSVTVKDACNNTIIKSITLTQPAKLDVGVLSVPTSSCSNSGQLIAIPFNGTSPYSYLWTNGANTQTISNLGTGTYRVTVTDACGATKRRSATISVSSSLSATTSTTVSSPLCDGTATANPSGGGTPYSYLWSNGQTTQTASNLCVGTYYVTVTDNCSLTVVSSVNVTSYSQIDATISGTNITCRGGNDGSATVNPFNGHPPYYYNWSNNANTQTINNLTAAVYTVTVTDSWSASIIKSIILTQPSKLSVAILAVPTSPCINTGQLSTIPSNGTSPYTFIWNNGATTQSIFNLGSGNYSVTVTDACGATKRLTATITKKTINITTSSTCSSPLCNGSVIANVTGGDAPFTYLWNDGQTTQTATNLCSGTYRVTVTDVNGCTKRKTNINVGACLKSLEANIPENTINEQINVFPNPASSVLNISFANNENATIKIEIYNLLGERIVFETYNNYFGDVITKDISIYSNGLYLLKLTMDDKEFTRRIIIQK